MAADTMIPRNGVLSALAMASRIHVSLVACFETTNDYDYECIFRISVSYVSVRIRLVIDP